MGRRTKDSEYEDEYEDEWGEDCEEVDVGRGRKRPKKDGTSRKKREPSIPWSEEEMERLLSLVDKYYDPDCGIISWAEVAAAMGNRNPKQCRGDLRPHISKAPWSAEEEYVLALAHSQLGNKWSEIAKFLPRRAENTIKNHWYATKRAKADSHTKSFLWLYCTKAGKTPSVVCFGEAKARWEELVLLSEGSLQPLVEFEVPEDYFTTGEGARQNERLQEAELVAAQLGPGHIPLRSATARAAALSTGGAPGGPTGGSSTSSGGSRKPRANQDGCRGSSVPPAGPAAVARMSTSLSDARGALPLPSRRRTSQTHSHTATTEVAPSHILWPAMTPHMGPVPGMPPLLMPHMNIPGMNGIHMDGSKQVRFSEGGVHSQQSLDVGRVRRFSEGSNRVSEGGWDGSCMVNVHGTGASDQIAAAKPPGIQLTTPTGDYEYHVQLPQTHAGHMGGTPAHLYVGPVAMYAYDGIMHPCSIAPEAEEALTALQDLFHGSGAGTVWECFEDGASEAPAAEAPAGPLWMPTTHEVPDALLGNVWDEACPPSPDYMHMTRLINNLGGVEEYAAPDLQTSSPLPPSAVFDSIRAAAASDETAHKSSLSTAAGVEVGPSLQRGEGLEVSTATCMDTHPMSVWSGTTTSVLGQTGGGMPMLMASHGSNQQQFAQLCGWGVAAGDTAQLGAMQAMWGAGQDLGAHAGTVVPPDQQVGPPLPCDYFASPVGGVPACLAGAGAAMDEDDQPADESSRVQFY